MTRIFATLLIIVGCLTHLQAADSFVSFQKQDASVPVKEGGIIADESEYPGVKRAIGNLRKDMQSVCGKEFAVTVGSIQQSQTIRQLIKDKKLDGKSLKGKTEKYLIVVGEDNDHNASIIIAGSDKRGTIYGIYELSRQLGVSPWSWWADMPVLKHENIFVKPGIYTDGEPVVRYRGIFLNDEAPCLSGWVNEKFPDSQCASADPKLAHGFNHNFYEKVFELLQRLKANYLWPAMWSNAFYADDPMNSVLADEMGIMMGTSHHEPMARNHQEWARHRKENGDWDYVTNQAVIDNFFREGVRRAKNNEDIITIGMRGDGDAAMGGKEGHDDEFVTRDDYYLRLYEKIFKNQRQIIKQETGKAPEKRTQIWALYKEVQRYYDLGLTVPEDVIILLCDDNWGNIRRVPTVAHKGGYGMYYHVDYVGAPRNTKWANVTPAAHLWEQMQLCYQYGIEKLWILNVGDLKPMEYPIQLFLDMAWNPEQFAHPSSIQQHTDRFCEGIIGADEGKQSVAFGKEMGRLLTQYTTYNGRVTPEMLNASTYNLQTGEWAQVTSQYKSLEADAMNLYNQLPQASKDSYAQLLLYPIQSMANLYEMYFAQARGDQEKVNTCFQRDQDLTDFYHHINGGKWNHLMDQTHIGYTSWNNPPKNVLPKVAADDAAKQPASSGFVFQAPQGGYLSIEAEHYQQAKGNADAQWLTIPNYGRTLSGVALWPYTAATDGAEISYSFQLPENVNEVKVHVITNSTLPFLRREGHRYTVQLDGGEAVEVNYNSDLTEDNQWHMYDIVATRVIEKTVTLKPNRNNKTHQLTLHPMEPGLVLEKIVVDYGGYQPQHLFGTESQFNTK
ncbi:MAG: glycosyl hydrolase 115 family protein [Bacteroidales bacterium]|nr:glycosyl hydrolase 115 family protein [Bacteroidales bacterium]